MKLQTHQKSVSEALEKRKKSFSHAFRGLGLVLSTQINARIQIVLFIIAIFFGFYFSIEKSEWFTLIISSGFVIALETINTAFEIDIDLTSPEYHPYARDTKDVAAGAVLISAIISVIVGCIIFLPRIF